MVKQSECKEAWFSLLPLLESGFTISGRDNIELVTLKLADQ